MGRILFWHRMGWKAETAWKIKRTVKESKAQLHWMDLSLHREKEMSRSSQECSFKFPVLSGERGSSQSFLVEMCSESWDCGFCTACSCDDEGSNCIPMSPGWAFSIIARGLAPACLVKKTHLVLGLPLCLDPGHSTEGLWSAWGQGEGRREELEAPRGKTKWSLWEERGSGKNVSSNLEYLGSLGFFVY